jgi:hypothetical protein
VLLLSVLTKGVVDNGGNLLPASLTRVAIRRRCHPAIEVNLGKDVTTIVADTGDKFAAGINDTGGQLAVLLILFAHLELRVSSRLCKIIRNGPNGIFRSLGKIIMKKI